MLINRHKIVKVTQPVPALNQYGRLVYRYEAIWSNDVRDIRELRGGGVDWLVERIVPKRELPRMKGWKLNMPERSS